MRELKFRTWNWLENRYDKNPCAFFSTDGELIPSINRIIEQYTGLKDKNGKEIYEGDIIRICRSYGYGFLPKGAVAVVSYDENECCYKLKKQGEFRLTSKKMVEVIGNIHENPELLEEEA